MIWVVDDNPAVAESLAALLMSEGLTVRSLLSGHAVKALLEEGLRPKAMLLDMSMPDDGGNAVLEFLLDHPEWIFPVLVLTGYPGSVRPELRRRVWRILEKPVDPLVLLEHLKRSLGLLP